MLKESRFVELIGDPVVNPYNWQRLTIKDVCSSIVRGPFGSALKKEFFVADSVDSYKVYEQKNAIQKNAEIGNYYIDKDKYEELKRFECVSGDILMSCSGTVGELYQLPTNCRKGVINQALCKFTLNNRILPTLFLSYMKEMIGNISTQGSAIKNVSSVAFIKSIPIIVPPIEVQKRYIAEVQQLDKLKVILEKIDEKFDQLKKSRFAEMFGDLLKDDTFPLVKFSECTNSMVKGPFGSDMKKDLYVPKGEDTYKVYTQINAIQKDETLGEYYISKDYFDKKIYRFEVKPKDFIITCDGTLGKFLQLDEKMEKGVISSSLLKVTINEEKLSPVFFETLWSDIMLPHMVHQARNACLVHLPSAKVIGEFEFHLPDLNKQIQFESFIKQLDKLKVDMVSKLLHLV